MTVRRRSPWAARRRAAPSAPGPWRRLPTKAKVGAVLLGFFVLAGDHRADGQPYDPSYQNPRRACRCTRRTRRTCSGTTQSGQDVLSQLLVGIRLTLELALIVGVVATALAVIVGVAAAFLGGLWDEVLSLATNVFLVIPALPLLILLLGYLPQKGQTATILVLSVLGWPWGARVIRAQTMAHPQPRLRGRRPRDRREHLADPRVRDRAERDQPDRGELREHRALRDRRLGGPGLHRPGRPVQLEPGHDALLGGEPAGAAARRLVVVRPARASRSR